MEFEPMLAPREKSPLPKMSPEEDRTRYAVDSEPKHYQLSYSGPPSEVVIRASVCRTEDQALLLTLCGGWLLCHDTWHYRVSAGTGWPDVSIFGRVE